MQSGHHIIADERRIPADPGRFNIDPPYQLGLEMWKATQLFDDRQAHGAHFVPSSSHVPLPAKLIDGRDGAKPLPHQCGQESQRRNAIGVRSLRSSRRRNVRGVTLDEMTRRVSAMVGAEVRGQESFEEAGRAGERDPGGGRSYGYKPGRGGCNPRQGGRTFCWRMRSRRPYGTIHRLLPCLRR